MRVSKNYFDCCASELTTMTGLCSYANAGRSIQGPPGRGGLKGLSRAESPHRPMPDTGLNTAAPPTHYKYTTLELQYFGRVLAKYKKKQH